LFSFLIRSFFLSYFWKANAIAEDIGYPSYIKNSTKLAAELKGVSNHYKPFLFLFFVVKVPSLGGVLLEDEQICW